MKVLLIQPPSGVKIIDDVYLNEPLALEYVGTGLAQDGHEVKIHDIRLESDYESVFLAMQPDIVGLTGITSQFMVMKEIAARIKSLRPETVVIAGGHHATIAPADFNEAAVDILAIGEGVEAMREITRRLESKQPLEAVSGLGFPGKEMRFTESRPLRDLDELPLPDRSLTQRYRQRYFNEWYKPAALVRTSLGCPMRCNFCSIWVIAGGKYWRRQPEKVVEEIQRIDEPNIYLADDEFMLDVRRTNRLADLIHEAGIRKQYSCYVRVDTIVRHPELLAKWRDIGLSTVYVGFESFSNERLKEMKKDVTIEQQEKAVKILSGLGIFNYAQFVVDPNYDRDDFKALTEYIQRLKLRYASFTILTPQPGTSLYTEKKKDLTSNDPKLYDFLHAVLPTKLPLPEFYAEYANLYIHSISLRDGLRTLMKYGLRRIPQQIRHGNRFIAQIREGYRDHEECAEISPNSALTG
ncbi:MAG: radical SAM protein [Candidatus Omnitrophota bacterium]